jgi:hypothetical protein
MISVRREEKRREEKRREKTVNFLEDYRFEREFW